MYYRLFNIAKKSVFLWFMLSQIVIAVPVPQLIKDVNTNQAVYRGSNFQIDIKGVLYYLDYKSEGSVELWRYDPSSSTGSVRVAFIKTDSEYEEYPNNFIEMDGVLYFTALYKTRYALWQYDPNASAGLVRVGDVMLIRPSSMTKVGGVLYFSSGGAIDGVGYKGTELWKYDPRSFSGPVLVADIDAGRSDSDPQHLTEIEGVLYFSADNGITGRELWKYDTRSSTGPVLVTDIHAGTGSSAPQNLTEIAGVLYFSADNGITGRELWKYDPSSSVSPVLVGDINVGTGSSAPQNLTEVAGVLYFSATGKTASGEVIGRELWQYDLSSSSSPVLVVDLNAGPDDSRPESLIGIEGVLYFSADDGVTGRELWQYDSSFSTSPVLVVDLNAGPDDSRPESLIEIEGVLYFSADDRITGKELWKYDPRSSTGPVLVVDLYAGSDSSFPKGFIEIEGVLYFSADRQTVSGKREDVLWLYDPSTSTGPVGISKSNTLGSNLSNLVNIKGIAYFSADSSTANRKSVTLFYTTMTLP